MHVRSFAWTFVLLLSAGAALTGYLIWTRQIMVPQPLRSLTPHERYAQSLASAGLEGTALGREWLAASRAALLNPAKLTGSDSRTLPFSAAGADAAGLAFGLRRGERFSVALALDGETDARVFVDLFEETDSSEPRLIAHLAEGERALEVNIRRDGRYVLRVQPELLRTVNVTVTPRSTASLRLPVEGATDRNIQSRFGADRDRGRRRHEGIDIFAPRGTTVRAAADGFVTSVGTNRLGGNVVWVWDPQSREAHYYAHLSEQLVSPGTRVTAGDAIGTVGNTGNARSTPPHLHFGIYALGEGAVDPLPYVAP